MKRILKNLLAFSALALMAGAAIGVNSLSNSEKTKVVEASNATNELIEIRFTCPTWWANDGAKIHTWNVGESGVDYGMRYLWDNSNGEKVYSWVSSGTNTLRDKFKFHLYNSWNNESSEFDAPTESKNYYESNGWKSTTDGMRMKLYLYDIDYQAKGSPSIHAFIENGNSDIAYTTWPGIAMTETTLDGGWGRVFEAEVSNAVDRVIFNNTSISFQTSDVTIPSDANNQVFVMGKNKETVPSQVSSAGEWWNNINKAWSHNFYFNIMDFRNLSASDGETNEYKNRGYCTSGSHYTDAKAAYTAMHENGYAEAYLKSNYYDAVSRLVKWALANTETFNPETGTFSSNNNQQLKFVGEAVSTNLANGIIITSSVITLTAIAGFFYVRRKHA